MITSEDKHKISQAIKDAEKTTSGEIVPIIVAKSDYYYQAHLKLSVIFALMTGLILKEWPGYHITLDYMFYSMIFGLIMGYLLAHIPFIKRILIKREVRDLEVYQRAQQSFFENNIHSTKDRTGILIFISLLERKALILADTGINKLVPPSTWDNLVAKLVEDTKQKDLCLGLINAINTCGNLLSHYFPIEKNDKNELADKLIIED